MSKQTKKVLAIVALAFMGVFTVSLVIWFASPNIFNGAIGYLTLFSGSVGIGIFLLIKLIKTPEEKEELAKKKADYLPSENLDTSKDANDTASPTLDKTPEVLNDSETIQDADTSKTITSKTAIQDADKSKTTSKTTAKVDAVDKTQKTL